MENLSKDEKTVKPRKADASVNSFSTAPVLVVAYLIMENMKKYLDNKRQMFEKDLAMQSLGAAIQNMLLSTSGNGLGACCFSAPLFCKNTVRQV